MLQACLNGARAPAPSAHVPCAPHALADAARKAVMAGATQLHVHPRGSDDAESLVPQDVADCLTTIRAAVPGIPVGISTGDWIAPGGRARQAHMRAWTELPDYVSVNLGEDDAPQVMALMDQRGIGIEAGLASQADAHRYAALTDRPSPLRILVEMPDTEPDTALTEADAVLAILAAAGIDAPILLHGEGQSAWSCVKVAAARGLQTRIGLEDVLTLPDGSPAPDNAALVAAAAEIIAQHGCSLA